MKTVVIVILILSASAVLYSYLRSGHFFKNVFSSAFQGVISLIAVNVTGLFTGVTLSLNWYSLGAVSIFGLPGTIALVILKHIFR